MVERVEIVEVDLDRADHRADVLGLTAAYGADAMGTAAPLPEAVLGRLIEGLRAHPTTLLLLAYDRETKSAIGLATCFAGFSTFHARPLINIHDLVVLDGYRGKGIGRRLLDAVEGKARSLDCCKVTLEVNQNNRRAVHLYESFGFAHVGAATPLGGALFYAKPISLAERSE